ncbi:hypothetical protein [Caballeronia sp. GAWG1-1]|nr:hypothetical protein [Caballeronia sp. GAWG1-1]
MSADIRVGLNAEGETAPVRDYVVEFRDRFFLCELRIKPRGYTPPRINFSDFSAPGASEENVGHGTDADHELTEKID